MQDVLNRCGRVLAISLCLIICAAALQAQQDAGGVTVAGTVVDQSGKAIAGASVVVKKEATDFVRSLTTDGEGHFSVSVPTGSYTLEVSAPGFGTARRTGVQAAATAAELSIALSVATLAQTVSVEAVVSLAAQLAPSGNTLDAVSAKTEIGAAFIQNFPSPLADFNEVIQMAPGTFSVNTNGVGLGQGKTFFRGFKDGQYSMTYDGIPFQDTK